MLILGRFLPKVHPQKLLRSYHEFPLSRPETTPCAAFCGPRGEPLVQHLDPLFSLKKVKKGFFRPQMLALPASHRGLQAAPASPRAGRPSDRKRRHEVKPARGGAGTGEAPARDVYQCNHNIFLNEHMPRGHAPF